ncbi:MAG: M20/M25/M40 family metallo-hydrolase, partial [Candidatus Omnitrophica bacterium]|nr:M20/M25/M40 family metallo-hydrolase [Candidatus Omnitrophota bacterium]
MKITRNFIDSVIIVLCVLALADALTFGLNFFAPQTMPKPRDAGLALRLKAHVFKLSEEIGERNLEHYPQLEQAADYIASQLGSYGYRVQSQDYILRGKRVRNIIARKSGSVLPNKVIIAGAHYDNVVAPGADDNASGVAAVLELARLLRDKPSTMSIEFCFFTDEED